MTHLSRRYEPLVAGRKRALFAEVQGTVVEIGPGTGVNFGFLPAGIRWIGIEPNACLYPRLLQAARGLGIESDIRGEGAEEMSVADSSADIVISTLVLCSVRNQRAALREIHRILKPGGRFVFLEHVAAERGTSLRKVQGCLKLLFHWLADGCCPLRDTADEIMSAGFSEVSIERFRLPLGPVAPHIAGVAER